MAAAVLAEAVSQGVSLVVIVGAGRCRVTPDSVALAECPTEYLENAHAILAVARFPYTRISAVLATGAKAFRVSLDK